MTIDLTDTTTGAIAQALTEARRRLGGMTLGMVLTLIIVTDEAAQYDAIRAANQAAREHPCRILAVITRKPKADSRLDAEIRVGESSPGETIVLRMYGTLGQHADSVVAPLLVPDVPVVTWWPDDAPEIPAKHPLGALAQRRVTDSATAEAPHEVLAALASGYQPGDTDFGWTRSTPWRSLLAATLDQPHPPVTSGQIAAEEGNPAADLIAAWLSLRLAVPVSRTVSGGPGITAVVLTTPEGDITITRADGRTATLAWPGRTDRMVALHRRDTAELLAEELRRLDPDEVYAETLSRVDLAAPAELPQGGPSPAELPPAESPAADQFPAPGEGELPSRHPGSHEGREGTVSTAPEVFVHASGDLLAAAAAARCVTRLADAIAAGRHAHLVLTGGGIGTKVLAAIAACPARDAVDWRRVDFWWGDERFVPAGDPERNETGARAALLDSLGVPETMVHGVSGPDGPDGDDPDAAASRYARELAAAAGSGGAVPAFDVLMLGIGPEGHVASIFPHSPAAHATGSVVAVRNSPKPPPTRISLTFSALQAAREVWVLASGAEKAEAVAEALSGASQETLPAAGARGTERTLFLLDEAAAAKLPPAAG